jgi:hypothetical protein
MGKLLCEEELVFLSGKVEITDRSGFQGTDDLLRPLLYPNK